MTNLPQALQDATDALHAAQKAARKANDPLQFRLAQICREMDEITDAAQPAHNPEPAA